MMEASIATALIRKNMMPLPEVYCELVAALSGPRQTIAAGAETVTGEPL